ncbi:exonuclease SbcCD subunit D C-terminal domain-containing protein [Prosthecobacter sp.]|uniref:exonuclease SbcCD subunit D C-terminal domain-containing protein n=1 Tax=Prosthecobacter sp. TaxID=1965333 RepID=UPI002AB9DAEC|nr:exonuclease SbcCD subunit D C-terminal domain-containing protein [Prosthecobacter sp.]MDZ4402975.1 exonuclease SbcCD subunit D C-terminal domain-containing protein [Prosthecobacter sp.]
MRILHTADWHLGARLVERDRLPEQVAFLDWLIDTLRSEKIDALLLSGDVFDAANPPQDAVALYFDFLKRLADLQTVKAVITGGNHDSASHLNAPRELLRRFEVHVFGHAGDNVVDLGGAVVAAVPFLRERDLRQAAPGETLATVHEQVRAAIRAHYAAQLAACREIANGRPVIAMGHLTVLGATTSDSERDIHIGNLGSVGADIFDGFGYTALGHLHRPQKVASNETIRYSGSPIPLSFSEAADAKSVVIIDTEPEACTAERGRTQSSSSKKTSLRSPPLCGVKLLPIPTTRALVRVKANRATLAADLANVPATAWAEVTVKLDAPEPDLDRQVREAAVGRFEVLKVLADLPVSETAPWQSTAPTLHDLQPRDVFRELLQEKQIEGDELTAVFDELLALREEKVIL